EPIFALPRFLGDRSVWQWFRARQGRSKLENRTPCLILRSLDSIDCDAVPGRKVEKIFVAKANNAWRSFVRAAEIAEILFRRVRHGRAKEFPAAFLAVQPIDILVRREEG